MSWGSRLLVVALSLGSVGGLLGACGGEEISTDRLLLDPDHPAWAEPAPSTFRARLETSAGPFVIEVHRDWAPIGADRFHGLVQNGFFDDSRFYRVVEGFIVQFGLPGDPAVTRHWLDRTIADDPVVASNTRGRIAYAMTGPDTRATQVYINLVDNVRLDSAGFAPFGEVVEGMEVLDRIHSGYGENAGGGMRRGDQSRIIAEGNAHLDRDYPELDRILNATIVEESGNDGAGGAEPPDAGAAP